MDISSRGTKCLRIETEIMPNLIDRVELAMR